MAIEFARDIFRPLGEDFVNGDLLLWTDSNGRRLSDRLWRAKQADRDAIDAILRGAVATGEDSLKAAKRLDDYLTPIGQATRTKTPRSGYGNYSARRLARTEMTRAFGQATIQAAALNPFVEGVKWNLSGRHGKPDECDNNAQRHSRGLPSGVYRTSEVPRYPNHPHDLCHLSPYVGKSDDDVVDQLRRDLEPQSVRLITDTPRSSGLLAKVRTLFHVARTLVTRETA